MPPPKSQAILFDIASDKSPKALKFIPFDQLIIAVLQWAGKDSTGSFDDICQKQKFRPPLCNFVPPVAQSCQFRLGFSDIV